MGELNPLDIDLSYMLDVLKKIHGMKMIVFESLELKKEFFGQFLKQFPHQNDLDKEKTKEILKKAQGIINEKFDDLEYIYLKERKYGSKLLKEKGKVWQILP